MAPGAGKLRLGKKHMTRMLDICILASCIYFLMLPYAYADDRIRQGTYDVVLRSWDPDGDKSLTLYELSQRRQQIFQAFDLDDNSIWNADEYETYILGVSSHRAGQPEEKIRDTALLFKTMTRQFLDTDGDGAVTLSEYVSGGDYWFEELDLDSDGAITPMDRELVVERD